MDPEQKTSLYVIECIDLIDFSFYSTYNSLSSFVVIMNENSIFKSGSIVPLLDRGILVPINQAPRSRLWDRKFILETRR